MRIAFLNQKGGVGKSTVCTVLAAALKTAGYRVAIDDRDVQFSAGRWGSDVGGVPLVTEMEDPEVILCDTPGRLDLQSADSRKVLVDIIESSDRVVLVTEKSPFSVEASKPMGGFIRAHLPKGAKAYVLFNKVRSATRVGKQDEARLAQEIGLPQLSNSLPLAAPFELLQSEGFSAVTGRHRELVLQLALELAK